MIGDYVVGLVDGTGKRLNVDSRTKEIRSEADGLCLLLSVKIFVAVQDAVGVGFTLVNEKRRSKRLRASAWNYLSSPAFRHDLEVLGYGGLDVELFVEQLRTLDETR